MMHFQTINDLATEHHRRLLAEAAADRLARQARAHQRTQTRVPRRTPLRWLRRTLTAQPAFAASAAGA